MKRKKGSELIALVLALTIVAAFGSSAFAAGGSLGNFRKQNTYRKGMFKDVAEDAWYADNVKLAFELGLVKGSGEDSFSPDDNISIAETITLAARLHSIYYSGSAEFTEGEPWYRPYVEYAVTNKIISAKQFSDYNAKATRAEFASIMAKAVDKAALKQISSVESGAIPDVAKDNVYYDEIYALYRAGVLTGNDSIGSFTPSDRIQRSAVAAIITRIADESLRIKITLTKAQMQKTLARNIRDFMVENVEIKEESAAKLRADLINYRNSYTIAGLRQPAIKKALDDAISILASSAEWSGINFITGYRADLMNGIDGVQASLESKDAEGLKKYTEQLIDTALAMNSFENPGKKAKVFIDAACDIAEGASQAYLALEQNKDADVSAFVIRMNLAIDTIKNNGSDELQYLNKLIPVMEEILDLQDLEL